MDEKLKTRYEKTIIAFIVLNKQLYTLSKSIQEVNKMLIDMIAKDDEEKKDDQPK